MIFEILGHIQILPLIKNEAETPLLFLLAIYAFLTICVLLCLFGTHRLYLIYLYYRTKNKGIKPSKQFEELPNVTIQLPIYNEIHVVERLIDAACNIEYPRSKLEIQILDDSTDETTSILTKKVQAKKSEGFDIKYVHRPDRSGYKAGNLNYGLKTVRGEFIAIFDADTLPPPDFLLKTIHYFTNPEIGVVQTRWDFINRNFCVLSKIQAIILDAQFIIEQTARNRSGRFINFYGTGGIIRKKTIESVGGWNETSIAEDTDFSFHAQRSGWKFVYCPETVIQTELPVEVSSFKKQQHRWIKGAMQATRNNLIPIMKSNLPFKIKFESFIHLASPFTYPMVFLLSLLMLPAILTRQADVVLPSLVDIVTFFTGMLPWCLFFILSQKELGKQCLKAILYFPMLSATVIGLCINNTRAVIEAFFDKKPTFFRTPKYHLGSRNSVSVFSMYKENLSLCVLLEFTMAFYLAFVAYYCAQTKIYPAIPYALLFGIGFIYLGAISPIVELLFGNIKNAHAVSTNEPIIQRALISTQNQNEGITTLAGSTKSDRMGSLN